MLLLTEGFPSDAGDRIILDGEMLVWDPVAGRNLPFGTLKTAALGALLLPHRQARTKRLYRQIEEAL
jgi:ATP-dependent DNA ligase